MEELIRGVERFRKHVFPAERGLFKELARSQRPTALMITCADSRIDPNHLTQSRPGDLFFLRNAGNFVPAYNTTQGAEAATVEYAVEVLGIRHIIICGHSDCGAMRALANQAGLDRLKSVRSWLEHGSAALSTARAVHGHLEGDAFIRALVEENVLAQIQHLKTHPSVAAGLRKGTLQVHGWVYEIEHGEVHCYDSQNACFTSLCCESTQLEALA